MTLQAPGIRAAVAVAVAGAMALAGAPASVAAETIPGVIATTSGVAGMTQSVSVLAPEQAGSTISLTASQGQAQLPLRVSLNRIGAGQVRWTPPTAGAWTISASDADLRPVVSRAAAMPTRTQVAVPTNPTQRRYSPIIATVEPGDLLAVGARDVEGTVTFREVVRGVIGEAQVEMAPDGTAVARLEWIPPGVATYAVTAEFTPAVDPRSGSPVFAPSTSDLVYFTAGIDPATVQLLMPSTIRVGYPAYVVAHVEDGRQGSISLRIDGRRVSLDQQVDARGDVRFTWLPMTEGVVQVQVVFHEPGIEQTTTETDRDGVREFLERITLSHAVEQSVDVLPSLPRNPISVTPVVKSAAETPWEDDTVVEYPAASQVRLVTSTGSGAPVVFVVSGSCAISGSTLLLPVTGGGCSIRFSSPGGPGYAANQARVTVSAVLE